MCSMFGNLRQTLLMLHAMLRMRMGFTPVLYIRQDICVSICAVLTANAVATREVSSLRSRSAMGTAAQCNDPWFAKILWVVLSGSFTSQIETGPTLT